MWSLRNCKDSASWTCRGGWAAGYTPFTPQCLRGCWGGREGRGEGEGEREKGRKGVKKEREREREGEREEEEGEERERMTF